MKLTLIHTEAGLNRAIAKGLKVYVRDASTGSTPRRLNDWDLWCHHVNFDNFYFFTREQAKTKTTPCSTPKLQSVLTTSKS